MSPLHRALTLSLAAASATAMPGRGAAQDDKALLPLRSLAATCAQCHGTAGRPPEGSLVPPLAGLAEAYTIEQMAAFKTGNRPATVMTQLAKGFSEAQVRRLAAYFAAQPR